MEDKRDQGNPSHSQPFQTSIRQMNVARNVLEELKAERNALDPSFVHCVRLLDSEINRLSSAGDPSQPQSEKIFVSFDDQKKFNLIGRLLGPKGLTLKRIQAETNTKMSILGRGSIKDRNKEEELRNSGNPAYSHLREDLHVLIEATPPSSLQKIAAGVAEVHKMLIPPEPGQPDFASKYEATLPSSGGYSMGRGPPPPILPTPGSPPSSHSGRGNVRGSRGMGGGLGGRGRGRGRGVTRSREDGTSGRMQKSLYGMSPSPGGSNLASGRDSWREGAISKDYNHGVSSYGEYSGGDSHPYGGDSYPSEDSYFNTFTDSNRDSYGGRGNGSSEWKSGRPPTRRDYRHHPYESGPPPSGRDYYY